MGAVGAHLIALKAEQKVGLTKHDTGPQILEQFSSLQLGMDHIGPEGKAFLCFSWYRENWLTEYSLSLTTAVLLKGILNYI